MNLVTALLFAASALALVWIPHLEVEKELQSFLSALAFIVNVFTFSHFYSKVDNANNSREDSKRTRTGSNR